MHEMDRAPIQAFLTAEVTRRFGAERAAALSHDLDVLAAELAQVALAEVPDETEPAFFLHEGGA